MSLTKAAHITNMLKRQMEASQASIAKFQADMGKNPVNALEWADAVYEATGRLRIAESILNAMEYQVAEGKTEEEAYAIILTSLSAEVIRDMRYLPSSSSQSSNIMANYMRMAKAWAVEVLS